jgi:hypothetical protein
LVAGAPTASRNPASRGESPAPDLSPTPPASRLAPSSTRLLPGRQAAAPPVPELHDELLCRGSHMEKRLQGLGGAPGRGGRVSATGSASPTVAKRRASKLHQRLSVQMRNHWVHLQTYLVQSFVLLFQNFEEVV